MNRQGKLGRIRWLTKPRGRSDKVPGTCKRNEQIIHRLRTAEAKKHMFTCKHSDENIGGYFSSYDGCPIQCKDFKIVNGICNSCRN
ncbi:hypothetical protein KKA15_04950 [Patescibacteria group bacterium]|nr:hypothetical protein [Patescibacteria group bacterium]